MVDRFDADNFVHPTLVVQMNMFGQLQLGLGRIHHQDLLRSPQGRNDGVIMVKVFGLPSGTQRAPLLASNLKCGLAG